MFVGVLNGMEDSECLINPWDEKSENDLPHKKKKATHDQE